ncbi:MAG TPA: ABC transporter permease [Bryobacteraceae bacterium]|nr:ABC transporter permease [Bryobacteraceae bacterium]
MTTFFKDVRFALRMLLHTPGFAAAAVVCLALGIGATSAIFSVVHAVLLKPLAYRQPDRLYRLYTEFPTFPNGGLRRFWTSPPEYDELSRELQSWESLQAWLTSGANLAGATDPIRVTSCSVTGGMFPMLGVAPMLGRSITPQDDVPGAPLVIVIGYDLWQRTFAGDRGVIGRTLQVYGRNASIVGVMPPGFAFPPGELDPPEVWSPLQLGPPDPHSRGSHFLMLLGRLRPGVSVSQARQELDRHVRESRARLGNNHPFDPRFHTIVTYALQDEVVRSIRPALWMLLGAVGFVLLIACVNVANLLLARAEARQREIAIRKALGAGVAQLLRQFIVEGLLLSAGGGLAGLALAYAGLKIMVAAGRASIPRAAEVSIDPTVLSVTLAVALFTAVVFGLAPLAQIAAGTLHDALKAAGGRTAGSVISNRFRSLLVAGELALALILLIGTGLMVRAFWKLSEVNPGFRADGLLTLRVNLPQATYPKPEQVDQFWRAIQQKVNSLPGVVSASVTSGLPPERPINANDTYIEGFTAVPNGPGHNIDYWQIVGDRYFETMGIHVIEGRALDSRDGPGAPLTAVINQTMARVYYGNQSPIGRRINPGGGPNRPETYRTIVGVVADVKNAALDKPAGTEAFFPGLQGNFSSRTIYILVRTARDPKSLAGSVRAAVREVDPSLPVTQVRTMDEVLASAKSRPQFLTTLLGLFSTTALLLAAVGLYGVISYSVTRRTTEFGIRMAMGAGAGHVLGLVLGQGLRLALFGVAAGAIGALALTRLIRGLLFGISSFDPITFVAMAGTLVAVTLLACVVPARRAIKVDPLVALRYE